ncbi:hypothetical protein M7I_3275 [Glarea lozoyensis 74030]|uniref:Uncharacterized protein n=1 Tax=Glarea lozoyensis (strain ATCC 74030 / MF5533) TaxID=1104152 RepID=H0EL39_GLAL7|nr:hypothetical protein M7I_3275 [Glarea lozoyensis 74030]
MVMMHLFFDDLYTEDIILLFARSLFSDFLCCFPFSRLTLNGLIPLCLQFGEAAKICGSVANAKPGGGGQW